MQRLYVAADLPEAHLVAQLLERAGIAARVFNEHAQSGLGNRSRRCSTSAFVPDNALPPASLQSSAVLGVVGEIPFTHAWPEVWPLEDADAPRAQRALDVWQRTPRMPSWRCRDCGDDSRDGGGRATHGAVAGGGGRAASGMAAEDNPGTFETCWRCSVPLTG